MDNASVAATSNDITPAEKFLREMRVPYELGDSGTIMIRGDLDLSGRGLTELPDLSNTAVGGNFNISNNRLESLQGCPKTVVGNFDASGNRLKSLEGGPELVVGNYTAQYNELESLEGSPYHVAGNFWVQHNKLASVANGPKTVDGDFFCYDNKLTSFDSTTQVAGLTHGGHIDTPQGHQSIFMKAPPLRQPAATGFTNTSAEPSEPSQEETTSPIAQTRFSTPEAIRKLQNAQLLINQRLNIDGFDQDTVKVKDAAIQGDWLNIELQNGDTVSYGKKNDGLDFIGVPGSNAPFTMATAMACASLAKTKGWDDLQLSGPPENQALLFLAAEKHGLRVANPPAQEHIDAARKQFEPDDVPAAQARTRPSVSAPAA
ncbi:MAG: hypothetical protein ACAH80_03465 [Alphaproteobacteria bacterium]